MKKILVSSNIFPSCRLIRDAIEKLTNKKFFMTDNPERVKDVLFRYGNTGNIIGTDSNFNSTDFISLLSDKRKFSNFCKDNGIYSPIFYTIDTKPEKYPILVRKTLTGFGGKGIIFCNNEEEYNSVMTRYYWWTPFIKCSYEIRVHLFDNKVSRIYKKVKEGEDDLPIRNSENGYHFSLQSENLENKYKKAQELATKLGELFIPLGGHFSGLDFGYDSEKKEYFVFEGNSAPGLSSINAEEYAKFFCEKLSL
jgi:glutathione synthase/RimK-type ligase-like ATP-grasp enzyme